jgi:hypothetical protein
LIWYECVGCEDDVILDWGAKENVINSINGGVGDNDSTSNARSKSTNNGRDANHWLPKYIILMIDNIRMIQHQNIIL